MFAKLVVVEGIDQVGKSTQSKLIASRLNKLGYKTRLFKVPFNDHVTHKIIYGMLFNGSARKYPSLFQFFQFLNKLIFQTFVLTFFRLYYDVIVLDRWTTSACVYGDADGASKFVTRLLNKCLVKPNVIVLITGPIRKRNDVQDSYEKDNSYQNLVAKKYKEHTGRPDVLHYDMDMPAEDLSHYITTAVRNFI